MTLHVWHSKDCVLEITKHQILWSWHKLLNHKFTAKFCYCNSTFCSGYNFECSCGLMMNHHCIRVSRKNLK